MWMIYSVVIGKKPPSNRPRKQSSPTLWHGPWGQSLWMKEDPPRYPWPKYECFLISSCRYTYLRNFKVKVCGKFHECDGRTNQRMNKWMNKQMNEQTKLTIFLYKYSRGNLIISTYFKSHPLFQIFGHLAFFKKQFCLKKNYIFSLLSSTILVWRYDNAKGDMTSLSVCQMKTCWFLNAKWRHVTP